MSEQPTYEELVMITKSVILGLPVPEGFQETEARVRDEVEDLQSQGLTPDLPAE